MKALTTVAMYGLVPVPPMQDAQSLGDNDDQPPRADDSNAALLAWYRHLATSDEITHARLERDGLEADLPAQGLPTKHVEPMLRASSCGSIMMLCRQSSQCSQARLPSLTSP